VRRLALPAPIGKWSLTSLQQRLVKTGGRLIQHARYYWLLLAKGHLDAAVVWRHAAEDRNAAVASGIGGLQSAANFGDEIEGKGITVCKLGRKNAAFTCFMSTRGRTGPLRRNGKASWAQNRARTSR
jgi:hypothetical protein